jgi:hypothetical protein
MRRDRRALQIQINKQAVRNLCVSIYSAERGRPTWGPFCDVFERHPMRTYKATSHIESRYTLRT